MTILARVYRKKSTKEWLRRVETFRIQDFDEVVAAAEKEYALPGDVECLEILMPNSEMEELRNAIGWGTDAQGFPSIDETAPARLPPLPVVTPTSPEVEKRRLALNALLDEVATDLNGQGDDAQKEIIKNGLAKLVRGLGGSSG